jgi:hypothetical protein
LQEEECITVEDQQCSTVIDQGGYFSDHSLTMSSSPYASTTALFNTFNILIFGIKSSAHVIGFIAISSAILIIIFRHRY